MKMALAWSALILGAAAVAAWLVMLVAEDMMAPKPDKPARTVLWRHARIVSDSAFVADSLAWRDALMEGPSAYHMEGLNK